MGEYSNIVSYEIAKALNNTLYADDKYAGEGNVTVTWDNYLGTKEYKEGELIDDGDNFHGKYYYAPHYSEVIDYLRDKYDIVVELIPVFTYALQGNISYYYKVYKINRQEAKLTLLFSDELFHSSFNLAMKLIIKNLIEQNLIEL